MQSSHTHKRRRRASCTLRILNARRSYWPTGDSSENKNSGCDYWQKSTWGGGERKNTDANVRRARLFIHWYTAFAIHYVFIEVQACGEQAKLQQTRPSRTRTGLTLAVASLMDRFNACSCSCSLGRKKHKSRSHDIAARRWKQFLFVWRFQERSINANEKSNRLYIQPLGCALRKRKVLTSFCDFPKKKSFFFRGCTDQKLPVGMEVE